jgi:hypothetical protein
MSTHTPQLRVSLAFADGTDFAVEKLAGILLTTLYGNPNFPSPPFANTVLETARNEFLDAIDAQENGGKAATAEKNNKREALIVLLRQLAAYVQTASANDMAKLLSSGFNAVNMNRAQSPLDTPLIVEIMNGISGQLIVKVKPVKNAKSYEVRVAIVAPGGATGPFQIAGVFTDSRQMIVEGLTPGTSYMVQVSAIGGSTGQSGWSDPVIHMCM